MSRYRPPPKNKLPKLSHNFNKLCNNLHFGTRFAFYIKRLTVSAMLFMNSCLVTEQVTFDPDKNVPPVLLDTPGSKTPIGEIIEVNLYDLSSNDLLAFELVFELRVRDENIDQDLEARWHLSDSNSSLQDKDSFNIEISWEPIRNISFSIGGGYLEIGKMCRQLELVVSSEFENSIEADNWDQPKTEDDIARAKWYIIPKQDMQEIIRCPATREYKSSDL